MKSIKRFMIAAAASIVAVASANISAEDFPTKPIRLIVGWPAGGTVDGVARIIAPALSESLGQPVIVENRAGATGSIGATEVAKAEPDGYTLGLVFDSQAVNHYLYQGLRYDPFKSFQYLSLLVTAPQILVASNKFPASDPSEFVKYAKAHPGKVSYASTGIGSSNHLNALLLAKQAGIDLLHVPYKGGAPAMIDLASGQVDIMIVSAPSTMPHVKAGRIKAIGVGTLEPLPQLPGVKPIANTIPGYLARSWVGLIAPAGMPEKVQGRLQSEIKKALEREDVRAKLSNAGYDIVGSSSREFTSFMHSESAKWGKIVKENHVKLDQ